ncbi:hypothetical protein D3C86_2137270 [compost metagenome]
MKFDNFCRIKHPQKDWPACCKRRAASLDDIVHAHGVHIHAEQKLTLPLHIKSPWTLQASPLPG